ncbi:YbhB/YbcL family Raf kinase inhibitor-like protein [Dongia sp.]|uniref:YbhB/YbcL family Raf kinase inhibitor-like protein n=1 Tax=Dongia sp. TaxID=1977262 RepID=UPI0035B038B7
MRTLFSLTAFLALATPALADGFTLDSPDLVDGRLPAKFALSEKFGFGCKGGNLSPALTWQGAPEGTMSFVLTIHDKDAPTGIGWMHWVVVNIPVDAAELATGASGDAAKLPAGALETRSDLGSPGYMGPCPPEGESHAYVFTLTALKVAKLPLDANATPALVGFFAKANALGEASLTVTQGRE